MHTCMMYVVLEKLSSVRNSCQKLFCCSVRKLKKRKHPALDVRNTIRRHIYKIEMAILQNFSTLPNRKSALILIVGQGDIRGADING